MTPKDKALELCQQYGYLGLKWKQTNYTTLALENAKQCALIDVRNTVKALEDYGRSTDELQNMEREFAWWDKVKQEIEKL